MTKLLTLPFKKRSPAIGTSIAGLAPNFVYLHACNLVMPAAPQVASMYRRFLGFPHLGSIGSAKSGCPIALGTLKER